VTSGLLTSLPGGHAIVFCAVLLAGVFGTPPTAASEGSPGPGGVRAPGVRIWYRTSEGCPEGSAFVARLSELGRQASLAAVGDRVDFVVTLAAAAAQSSGRLERQTESGTVAIRELSAARCEEVAEALALSLELALEPEPQHPAPLTTALAEPAIGVPAAPAADATPTPSENPSLAWRWAVGAQASLETGIAPGALFGAALFLDVAPSSGAASGRLSLLAAHRGDSTALAIDVTLLGGRLEGCFTSIESGAVAVETCAGADLGALTAASAGQSGRRDTDVWASGDLHVRGRWRAGDALGLEFQIGTLVPLVRYRFGAESGAGVYRTAPAGLRLSLGFSWAG
jgi:hypothetical protein